MANKNKAQQKKQSENRFLLIFISAVLILAIAAIVIVVLVNRSQTPDEPIPPADIDSLDTSDLDLFSGYFEEEANDVIITCLSGTPDCYTWEGNTLTFSAISEESVYSIAGKLKGNIVIDVGDTYKFDLEMHGFSLIADSINPITILSGDKVTLTAKKDFENYIYDMRETIDSTDETLFSGAVYATVDLEIAGKGSLSVISENNNGIHTKDDLEVKNLTLIVSCVDNALKGNDSVTIEGGACTLIAKQGDGIKTTNSDISEKGNQRGTVTVLGGTHTIGAACDGIDAAYNVLIDDTTTTLNIYTDKYSSSSEEVTATSESTYYLRYTKNTYRFSVKYYNSDEDYVWVNVGNDYKTVTSSGNRPGSSTTYYYYSFAKNTNYAKLAVYMYTSSQEQGQDSDYYACSSYKALNNSYDTIAVSYSSGALSLSWTNYTTTSSSFGPSGMGGMNEGNPDKGDYSTKGIKAANEITVLAGNITVKSYDDAIHANNDIALENGATPLGNVTVNGGTLTLYSNDDGIHADGTFSLSAGTVSVLNAYEGAEGAYVNVSGGSLSICSSDDGINGTVSTGTSITISGGLVYIYCNGDGLDTNTSASYVGIVFDGGKTVVISTSSGNSAIDTEQGYQYNSGTVLAVMPGGSSGGFGGGMGGMTSEATHCSNFSSVGTTKSLSLSAGAYLTAAIGDTTLTVKMPSAISSAYVIALGDSGASITNATSSSATPDANGVCWG